MIVKPSVTELLTKTENRYELVVATSKRARQIVNKKIKEKEISSTNNKDKAKEESSVTIAAEEIASGKVKVVKKEEVENKEENE